MKKLLLFVCAAFLFSCSSNDDSPAPGDNDDDDNTTGVAYVRGKMDNAPFDYTFNNTIDDTFLYNAISGFMAKVLIAGITMVEALRLLTRQHLLPYSIFHGTICISEQAVMSPEKQPRFTKLSAIFQQTS